MTELSLVPIDTKPVEIVAIIDRSGSMGVIRTDAIGGFNTFIEEQKALDGEARVTIALFDDRYDLLQNGVDLKETVLLNNTNYVPRGSTALLDAIGKTVNTLKERRLNGEVDGAIITILTDGHENCSKEYTTDQIKTLIQECEKEYGWTFVYLAANQDAFAVGATFGISAQNAVNFDANGAGLLGATRSMGDYASNYRASFAKAGPIVPDADSK